MGAIVLISFGIALGYYAGDDIARGAKVVGHDTKVVAVHVEHGAVTLVKKIGHWARKK